MAGRGLLEQSKTQESGKECQVTLREEQTAMIFLPFHLLIDVPVLEAVQNHFIC
jgi:hypothetical protein